MADPKLTSTASLIYLIQGGDSSARELLVERSLPLLRRWAHGRLPTYGRALSETDDLVQVTLMRAMEKIDDFQPGKQGAFLAYLRQILLNTIRNEIRHTRRRPLTEPLKGEEDRLISRSDDQDWVAEFDAYEKGLSQLSERYRQAVILRVEFGMTYPEITEELRFPSVDAARMAISRSLVEIAEVLA